MKNRQKARPVFALLAALLVSLTGQAQILNALSQREQRQGWILLFNGRDLDGWNSLGRDTGPERGWLVENGEIVVNKGGRQRGGDIVTEAQFSEFDLRFEFKLTLAANSGVKYFVTRYERGGWLGNEYQILDDNLHPDAKQGRDGNRKTASLYDLIPAGKKTMNPPGQWNSGRVVVRGDRVIHYLNGKKVLSYDRSSPAYREAWRSSKFRDTEPMFGRVEAGHILLQDHSDEVSFRNIKIRDLSE